MKNLLLKSWPFFIIIFVVFLFFWKVFLLKQVPIPGDFIVGNYFPWLDYKWDYKVGVPIKNPMTSDVVSLVYPLRSYAVDMLKQGRFPLWNPSMFTGYPLFANYQVAVFSPTTIFYLFLPKIWAWTMQVMFQPVLAAVFTYLLLRNFGLGKKESIFGGLFYAFSSFNIIWLEWATHGLVAAFIPLIIYLFDKFTATKKILWGVLLSIVLCLQLFSGYPQLVAYTLISLFIFALFHKERFTKTSIFLCLYFILLGILLSAIHTLPAFELILNSQRRYETLEPSLIYLPWQNLVTFLSPDYFGNPATVNYFGVGNYTINAGYSGVIVLILAIIGTLVFQKNKVVKYYVALILFALLASLPTPLAKAIFESPIPGISATSNTRILVLANLSLSVLAAFGLASLFKVKKDKLYTQKVILVSFFPLFILVGAFVVNYYYRGVFLIASSVKNQLDITLRNLILPIALASIASILILLKEKIGRWSNFLALIIGLLAVTELFRYGWKYTPFSNPNLVFPETPVLSFLGKETEPYRISSSNVFPMNMWVPYNLESVSGYDAVYPIWWAKLFSVISSANPKNPPEGRYAPFGDEYTSPWFELLNDKYVFILKSDKFLPNSVENVYLKQFLSTGKFVEVFQDKSVVIFKNSDVLPRAFFVTDWEVLSDEESLEMLVDPNFPLNKKIIIDKHPNIETSREAISTVHYDFYSAEKSLLSVNSDKDGFLFVSDAWYPGWKAKVDGVDAPIYRADYAFRAVPVLEGVHKVELLYEPESFKIGILTTFVTSIFLAGVLFYDFKIKK